MDEPKVPKGEIGWVGYYNRSGKLIFVLTSKEKDRSWYFLYEVNGNTMKKLGKAHTPPELENKYHVLEKMHEE